MDAFTSLDKSRQISDLEHQQEILRQEIDRLRQEIDALRQALLNFLKKS
jgi:prefoldin subunit 5